MRVEPISFRQGQNVLDEDGQAQIDAIAELLNLNYPDYRIAVRGHTGAGDEDANYQLSLERAQAVAQRLTVVGGTDADRLHAEGKGSKQPPPRLPGESIRAYQYRLPRVEFVLLEDNTL
jgi:outer membrane protein OmpA-like peptidoglycan-associated protein